MIQEQLLAAADPQYRAFNAKLIPNVDADTMLGVRVPQLRSIARMLVREQPDQVQAFMSELPHHYFEENMLHAILIGQIARDEREAIVLLNAFLPFADNWAVTDTVQVRVKHDSNALLEAIRAWVSSEHPFTARLGVILLMKYFLDERFDPEQLHVITGMSSDEYYVNMARAWYMATALAKQWESASAIIERGSLDTWTHNKSIQKACESYRVSAEHKQWLKQHKR